jgi:hypothetical protein
MARGSSNRAFRKSKNVRKGSGPVHYKWQPKPFEKLNTGKQRGERIKEVQRNSNNPTTSCGLEIPVKCSTAAYPSGTYYIDGVVMYAYDVLCDGNHLAYVECDYVE